MVCPSSLRLDLHLVLSCSIYFLWLWNSSSAGRWGSAIPGTYSSWVFVSLPLTGMMRERCLLLVQESLNHIIEPAEFLFDPFSPFRGAGDNTTRFFWGNFSRLLSQLLRCLVGLCTEDLLHLQQQTWGVIALLFGGKMWERNSAKKRQI